MHRRRARPAAAGRSLAICLGIGTSRTSTGEDKAGPIPSTDAEPTITFASFAISAQSNGPSIPSVVRPCAAEVSPSKRPRFLSIGRRGCFVAASGIVRAAAATAWVGFGDRPSRGSRVRLLLQTDCGGVGKEPKRGGGRGTGASGCAEPRARTHVARTRAGVATRAATCRRGRPVRLHESKAPTDPKSPRTTHEAAGRTHLRTCTRPEVGRARRKPWRSYGNRAVEINPLAEQVS